MAKAGVGAKPKLSFREQGEAKPEISTTSIHAQKQVRESIDMTYFIVCSIEVV